MILISCFYTSQSLAQFIKRAIGARTGSSTIRLQCTQRGQSCIKWGSHALQITKRFPNDPQPPPKHHKCTHDGEWHLLNNKWGFRREGNEELLLNAAVTGTMVVKTPLNTRLQWQLSQFKSQVWKCVDITVINGWAPRTVTFSPFMRFTRSCSGDG